ADGEAGRGGAQPRDDTDVVGFGAVVRRVVRVAVVLRSRARSPRARIRIHDHVAAEIALVVARGGDQPRPIGAGAARVDDGVQIELVGAAIVPYHGVRTERRSVRAELPEDVADHAVVIQAHLGIVAGGRDS